VAIRPTLFLYSSYTTFNYLKELKESEKELRQNVDFCRYKLYRNSLYPAISRHIRLYKVGGKHGGNLFSMLLLFRYYFIIVIVISALVFPRVIQISVF